MDVTEVAEKHYPPPDHLSNPKYRRLWRDACRVLLGNGDYQKTAEALKQTHGKPDEDGKGIAA